MPPFTLSRNQRTYCSHELCRPWLSTSAPATLVSTLFLKCAERVCLWTLVPPVFSPWSPVLRCPYWNSFTPAPVWPSESLPCPLTLNPHVLFHHFIPPFFSFIFFSFFFSPYHQGNPLLYFSLLTTHDSLHDTFYICVSFPFPQLCWQATWFAMFTAGPPESRTRCIGHCNLKSGTSLVVQWFRLLPGEFHGQRSLADYSPWGHKELDTTERLSTHTHT